MLLFSDKGTYEMGSELSFALSALSHETENDVPAAVACD
jgi:hypothetical protein